MGNNIESFQAIASGTLEKDKSIKKLSFTEKWVEVKRLRQTAYSLKKAAVKMQHPEWDDHEVENEVKKGIPLCNNLICLSCSLHLLSLATFNTLSPDQLPRHFTGNLV